MFLPCTRENDTKKTLSYSNNIMNASTVSIDYYPSPKSTWKSPSSPNIPRSYIPLPAVTSPSNCPQLAKSDQSNKSELKIGLLYASAPSGVGGTLLLYRVFDSSPEGPE